MTDAAADAHRGFPTLSPTSRPDWSVRNASVAVAPYVREVKRLRLSPLPSALLGACVVAAAAIVALGLTTLDPRPEAAQDLTGLVAVTILIVIWGFVGALIASRHPKNATGWLLLGMSAVLAVGIVGDTWGSATTTGGEQLPGHVYAGWVGHFLGQNPALFGLVAIVLLHFPTGQPPSDRWRWVVRWLAVTGVLYTLLAAVRPGDLAEVHPPTANPFAISAVGVVWPVVDTVFAAGFLLAGPVSIVGVALRFRRSSGVERQQLKWLLAGAVGMVALLASGPALFWRVPALQDAWTVAFVTGLALLPLSVGVAMLRHGLYEIDRIVSRTVTYAVVAALLAAAYAGTALAATSLLRPVTSSSDLPVAMSTLLVAAAVRPLHRRIRAIVERRFNRRRYDAVAALDRLGQSLRDHLDATEVERRVTALVATTFEPQHVTLWVGSPKTSAGSDIGVDR